ncbi:MAG: xanthine dehydrogenase family protein molybdopterin-binding subunit [Gammaproteobacteria bacterium]|nr:xanthine dehydrogenase family protein molybdopterin-binding subunit [Gammaproteobacteria bacterium]
MFENGRFSAKFPRPTLDRRGFLQVIGLSGAGFLIGCSRSGETVTAGGDPDGAAIAEFGPFIRIGSDNAVTVVIKHLDKGQGVTTGLPTIVAEELDAAWTQMRAEFAPADVSLYNNLSWGPIQGTGGSSSVANSWMQLREAAAAARSMLVTAASEKWQVASDEITVSSGVVGHRASGNSATFGDLAARAAGVAPPATLTLKKPQDFSLIGTRLPRLDSPAKTDGSAEFTIDISRPGMVVALVAHPPRFGATVRSFDASQSLEVAGVSDVVEIPRGVAVVADSFWSAKKGRDALTVDWDFSKAENRSSEEIFAHYKELAQGDGLVAHESGDAAASLASAQATVRREFRFPFLAHAAMEPMDCVVEIGDQKCDIWTGSQFQTNDQYVAAEILGIQPEQVEIHTHFAGGSFGRRAVPDSDYVAEAVTIAKAIGGRAPVKLIWTREDDMRAGRYRPMSHHVLEGGVDDSGEVSAWRHKVTMQSFMAGTAFEAMIQNGIDGSSVEGARNLPYAIENMRVELQPAENGVPTLWWRSVGHSHNAFATEAFFDEMAHLAGKDPYEYRRDLLAEHPRYLQVLDLVAKKAGWGDSLGENRGRGIAIHKSYGTIVAEVVDVTLTGNSFTVDKVYCAVDCGIAINPDVVRAQMEGGIGFGLSAALREQVTLENGEVQQTNFNTYRSLRIDEMPDIEVHIVPSNREPSGVGEPGVPPLAPALANALFDASGRRVYRLPIGDQLWS